MTYRRHSKIFISEVDDQFNPLGQERLLIENAQDGRLCALNGSLCCSYSSVSRDERFPNCRCHMHVCRLDDDLNVIFDKHFDPIKKELDKNWVFCSLDGEIFCIYDYQPELTVWRMDENFEVVDVISKKQASWAFGTIRGNTPPILINGNLVMIVHSIIGQRTYVNAVLRLTKGFDVISIQKLDVDDFRIVFPCGLAERHGRFFVSYGADDRCCKVRELVM